MAQVFKGTVYAVDPFDANEDAAILLKAMECFITDKQTLINVITKRSNAQRLDIRKAYKTLYGKDLISDMKSELSGNFQKIMIGLMSSICNYYAKELYDSMEGLGTDEDALIEILCTLTNHQIKIVCATYEELYGKSLENDIIGDTSGHFRRLLVSLCQGNRDESGEVDNEQAQVDAQALFDGGEKIWGTDESLFNSIMVTRNYNQLIQIFEEYEKLTGHDFEVAIKREFSGDICKGHLAIVSCVKSKAKYFASRLHYSMKGLGTDDRTLIRIIVLRSEFDLGEIKEEFEKEYKSTLVDWIAEDTSGYYRRALLSIVAT